MGKETGRQRESTLASKRGTGKVIHTPVLGHLGRETKGEVGEEERWRDG